MTYENKNTDMCTLRRPPYQTPVTLSVRRDNYDHRVSLLTDTQLTDTIRPPKHKYSKVEMINDVEKSHYTKMEHLGPLIHGPGGRNVWVHV